MDNNDRTMGDIFKHPSDASSRNPSKPNARYLKTTRFSSSRTDSIMKDNSLISSLLDYAAPYIGNSNLEFRLLHTDNKDFMSHEMVPFVLFSVNDQSPQLPTPKPSTKNTRQSPATISQEEIAVCTRCHRRLFTKKTTQPANAHFQSDWSIRIKPLQGDCNAHDVAGDRLPSNRPASRFKTLFGDITRNNIMKKEHIVFQCTPIVTYRISSTLVSLCSCCHRTEVVINRVNSVVERFLFRFHICQIHCWYIQVKSLRLNRISGVICGILNLNDDLPNERFSFIQAYGCMIFEAGDHVRQRQRVHSEQVTQQRVFLALQDNSEETLGACGDYKDLGEDEDGTTMVCEQVIVLDVDESSRGCGDAFLSALENCGFCICSVFFGCFT